MRDVGVPAFFASAHGVMKLVAAILPYYGDGLSVSFADDALSVWLARNPGASLPSEVVSQRAWNDVGARGISNLLIEEATGVNVARLRAVTQPKSGAWLHALPSPHLGTLLDSDSLRVAVALRLGCNVCEPHLCVCGSAVEANGHHALSCSRCAGRFPRHHALNDIIRRALVSAQIPCVLEPPGLSRTDGKRPDGFSLVPWKCGRCLMWDATCVSTYAASHLSGTIRAPGAAAEGAASRKRDKYKFLCANYHFVPFAVETAGCWGNEAKAFIAELGGREREEVTPALVPSWCKGWP
ncbi:hypothetical protein NE865_04544 [Phthorimaea operculella]|nr:hypothetical protein NE865_04544 [Phthorimaea operculella]